MSYILLELDHRWFARGYLEPQEINHSFYNYIITPEHYEWVLFDTGVWMMGTEQDCDLWRLEYGEPHLYPDELWPKA